MENTDYGGAAFFGFPDEFHNRRTILAVKRRCRLVQKHNGVIRGKNPGDVDPLLFAAGKSRRRNIPQALGNTQQIKQALRFPPGVIRAHTKASQGLGYDIDARNARNHPQELTALLSNGFEVREVRHLDESGHQTAVLATTEMLKREAVAAGMFGRWSQENFLKYMREHYALDRLVSYQVSQMDETTTVVNPAWRKLDRLVRSLTAKLHPKLARFGAMSLAGTIEPEVVGTFLKKKAALQTEVQQLQTQLQEAKAKRGALARHLPLGQVPEAERFDRLSTGSKDLVDTIKLVAYRAETAMAHMMREALPKWRQEEERRLLQSLYASEADLIPDEAAGTLTLRLHYPANPLLAGAVEKLCEELTATETVFPTTKLRLVYELANGVPASDSNRTVQPTN